MRSSSMVVTLSNLFNLYSNRKLQKKKNSLWFQGGFFGGVNSHSEFPDYQLQSYVCEKKEALELKLNLRANISVLISFFSLLFPCRRSFCSGSSRSGLVCIWIVQQDGQQSRCSATAAATEHTYLNLNLQQLLVLTNSQPFLPYFLKPSR